MAILQTSDLRKEYGPTLAVKDLNFSLEKGQVLGLVGPNGAGKTTLLRMLATVLKPTSGTAEIFEQDIRENYLEIRRKIGFMPDFFNLYSDLTLEECLEFFAKAYRIEPGRIPNRVNEVLDYVNLKAKRTEFVRHLSRGMVQRMGVAALMVHEPELFLLDEPASGLDPRARVRLRETLKNLSEEGRTIVISSHILTELSGLCSHIAIMNRGEIEVYGSVEEIEKKVESEKKVRFDFINTRDVKQAREIIGKSPKFKVDSAENYSLILSTTSGREDVAELNASFSAKGLKVYGVTEQRADLEDLFMKIESDREGGE